MTVRLARALASLYPSGWQDRYAEEFVGFLKQYPATPRTLLDVIGSAVGERFRQGGRYLFRDRQNSIVLMMYALLTAFAAAINLFWTVDDSPFAVQTQSDRALTLCWFMVTGGGFLAFLAACGAGLRLLGATSSKEIVSALLLMLAPCSVTLCWFAGVLLWAGGHWAPMPWAVSGDGAGWPTIETRWRLALISLVLLIVTMALAAVGMRRILRKVIADEAVKIPVWTAAAAIVTMACGCFSWGLLVDGSQSFHQQGAGGILNSSPFQSWLISCSLLAASGIAALLSAKQAESLPGA